MNFLHIALAQPIAFLLFDLSFYGLCYRFSIIAKSFGSYNQVSKIATISKYVLQLVIQFPQP